MNNFLYLVSVAIAALVSFTVTILAKRFLLKFFYGDPTYDPHKDRMLGEDNE